MSQSHRNDVVNLVLFGAAVCINAFTIGSNIQWYIEEHKSTASFMTGVGVVLFVWSLHHYLRYLRKVRNERSNLL